MIGQLVTFPASDRDRITSGVTGCVPPIVPARKITTSKNHPYPPYLPHLTYLLYRPYRPLPTLPTLTWRSRPLPRTQGRAPAVSETPARLSRCRLGNGSLSLLSAGRRLEAGLGRVRWEKVVRGGQTRRFGTALVICY